MFFWVGSSWVNRSYTQHQRSIIANEFEAGITKYIYFLLKHNYIHQLFQKCKESRILSVVTLVGTLPIHPCSSVNHITAHYIVTLHISIPRAALRTSTRFILIEQFVTTKQSTSLTSRNKADCQDYPPSSNIVLFVVLSENKLIRTEIFFKQVKWYRKTLLLRYVIHYFKTNRTHIIKI